MSVASLALFLLAPWIGDRLEGFDGPTRALYVDLLRINCLAQILFAASFALGEILVANRRFVCVRARADPLHGRDHRRDGPVRRPLRDRRHGLGRGRGRGRPPRRPRRSARCGPASGSARPSRSGSPAFREFVRLMLPRMVSHPIELLMLTWFTVLATGLGAGSVTSFNFASDYQVVPILLIGAPFSLAVFPTLSAAFADGDPRDLPGRARAEPRVDRAAHDAGRRGAVRRCPGPVVEVLLGGGRFGPEDVTPDDRRSSPRSPCPIPFDALAYPLSRGLYATHDTVRQAASSFVALGVVVAVSSCSSGRSGSSRSRSAYAAGVAAKDLLLGDLPGPASAGAASRPTSARRADRDRRHDRDEQAVALRVVALRAASSGGSCAPSRRRPGTCRADRTGPRCSRPTGTTGRARRRLRPSRRRRRAGRRRRGSRSSPRCGRRARRAG